MLVGLLNELIVGCSCVGKLSTSPHVGDTELQSPWEFTGEGPIVQACSLEDPFSSSLSSDMFSMV